MKIRTLGQLQDSLDSELGWRIKEISDIKTTINASNGTHQKTLMRAGVPLLYAHWEGFVKRASDTYINFVAYQRLNLGELSNNFVALSAKTVIHDISDSDSAELANKVVDFLWSNSDSRAPLPKQPIVSTKSNLSSSVFKNISNIIGVDWTRYSTRFNLIDSSLVERRNYIAHGEFLDLHHDSYQELSDDVVELLRWVKTDIENGASTGSFRRGD